MFTLRRICKVASLSAIKNYAVVSKPLCYVIPERQLNSYTCTSLLDIAKNMNVINKNVLNLRSNLLQINRESEIIQQRNVTQYSRHSGKRRTVKAVLKRFYRLDWGIWIRTKCGRHKKMYKKSSAQKRRLKQHVFCNAQQSNLLDKMVTKFWKKPKYFVDDPYQPYHKREEFPFSRKKPEIKITDF